tara:strand:+ start:1166 stop:1498 length:333 start_codon:yes stop_codon:yes gene_type:complete
MVKPDNGMVPGEVMRFSTVEVRDRNPLSGDMTIDGVERRPEFYIVVVRRLDLDWTIEILKGEPLSTGVLPDKVVDRISALKATIVKAQRSARGRDAAAARKFKAADIEEG